ncbi:MAG: biotin--[acetyl-CoA-carboxylase] ligase [Anaerolineales bacterium]
MDSRRLTTALKALPLGGLRYLEKVGSTNDVALAWAADGAADFSLVVSDEQTAGRGRGGRRWYTPPGAALAFSLILRPQPAEQEKVVLFSALGALAVAAALEGYALSPQIKWPNDVLLRGRKVSGVLAETVWLGEQVDSLVIGVGVNVSAASLPPDDLLTFPAACLESELGRALDRAALLGDILSALLTWRSRLGTPAFLEAWESRLAFRGERVEVWADDQPVRIGRLAGLDSNGGLRLHLPGGETLTLPFGEVHLRPVM